MFHVEPGFYQAWGRVKRLSKQRNALLKTASSYRELSYLGSGTGTGWLSKLASGVRQITLLIAVAEATQKICQAFLPEISRSSCRIIVVGKKTPRTRSLLRANFERDRQLGYTVSGPNKADLRIKVAGTPVEDVLSRGQLKLMVCALRLARRTTFD